MQLAEHGASYVARYRFWARMARLTGYKEKIIARKCNITVRQLQRIFKRDLGFGPEEWLTQLRLLDARYLLQESRQIKGVVADLGFKQESHFFRKFKEAYGTTPSHFLRVRSRADVAVEQ
jgi:AraC-like DNA-binding protein